MDKKKLIICTSGGLTSGYMAYLCKERLSDEYDMRFVFANTGQELEETLVFVNELDKHFNLNIVWVEADVNPEKNKGTGFKIVDFKTASRNGEPFEEVIKKYGISNQSYLHCTRELKEAPIGSWAKQELGKDYYRAIGMRSDEARRVNIKKVENERYLYPLFDWGIDKQDVHDFWDDQEFTLGIENYQGNCSWCWKKSFKKHFRLIKENPSIYDFPLRMEEKYPHNGANPHGERRVFFRGHTSTKELFKLAELNNNDLFSDEMIIKNTGCEDECQPFTD